MGIHGGVGSVMGRLPALGARLIEVVGYARNGVVPVLARREDRQAREKRKSGCEPRREV